MKKKNIFVFSLFVCIVCYASFLYFNNKDAAKIENKTRILSSKNISEKIPVQNKENIDNNYVLTQKNKTLSEKKNNDKSINNKVIPNETKKTDMFDDISSSAMPLSVITLIADLPTNIKDTIVTISKSHDIYMIQKHHDKLLIITNNPENIRHGIEFTELSLLNGHQSRTTLGYNDRIKDSENDIWEYDTISHLPLRHTKYNNNGDMEFVELWNYDENTPVKYQMKDSNGKVISMRNETITDGTNLRVENLLYDNEGNTKISISTTYEGDDIKRFNYYNADKLDDSGSVFSDYKDGLKTKETVYSADLKIKNTYTSDYKDGNRENIIIWNNQNQEIKKYLPQDNL